MQSPSPRPTEGRSPMETCSPPMRDRTRGRANRGVRTADSKPGAQCP
jgi:hypothetical protein